MAEGCSPPVVVLGVVAVLVLLVLVLELGGVVWLLVVAEGEGETAV
jgi:hypothetical protein